jgi:hypothetical protein
MVELRLSTPQSLDLHNQQYRRIIYLALCWSNPAEQNGICRQRQTQDSKETANKEDTQTRRVTIWPKVFGCMQIIYLFNTKHNIGWIDLNLICRQG